MRKLDVFLLIDIFVNNCKSIRTRKELSLFSKKLHSNLVFNDNLDEFESYLRRSVLFSVNDTERELFSSFIKFLCAAKSVCR